MRDLHIQSITAREVLDSKGRPTVEVDVVASNGALGRGSAPCGTSVGSHEGVFLRDRDSRYGGQGVLRAVENVKRVIGPALLDRPVTDQEGIDRFLISLDGTDRKTRLGANAIYSVSVAVARAGAAALNVPLYRYLAEGGVPSIPMPAFNVVNGGSTGLQDATFQEFLLLPMEATYAEALRVGAEVFSRLGQVIARRFGPDRVQVGRSSGYAAPAEEPKVILETLLMAAEDAGYGDRVRLGLDCAATQLFKQNENRYALRGELLTRDEMIRSLEELVRAYPLVMLEDPLHEDDFDGFAQITARLPVLIAGDDLFVTSLERLKKGILGKSANSIVIKPNMVGTLTEALETARHAKQQGYVLMPSIRSGSGADDPIADVAVAVGAQLIKAGAPRSGERTACHNQLLRIAEQLKGASQLPALHEVLASAITAFGGHVVA